MAERNKNRPTGSGLAGVRPEASIGWATPDEKRTPKATAETTSVFRLKYGERYMKEKTPVVPIETNSDHPKSEPLRQGTIILNGGGKNSWTGKR